MRPSDAPAPEPAAAVHLCGKPLGRGRVSPVALPPPGGEPGLIAPLAPPRLWTRHILNSALVAPLLHPGRVGDVGSGAGLPGIVLAIMRPDVSFTLIEPMERRVAWLERQVTELELTNVDVVRARAEEAKLKGALDQVTARAVSALRTLIPITAPLLRPGGELVLMKGAGVEGELAAAEKAIRKFRVHDTEVLVLGEGVVDEVTRVFRAVVG